MNCFTIGIFQGSSTLLLGAATGDDVSVGMELVVNVGDVIVLPAGTAHSSVESTADYRYVGVYPEVRQLLFWTVISFTDILLLSRIVHVGGMRLGEAGLI
jgi:uncharacterized protein YjlB